MGGAMEPKRISLQNLVRKKRWLWAFLPLLALCAFELFVDPFPDSIWLLRVFNTKYLVHVRAELTVDGEALSVDRTIRCFHETGKPVPIYAAGDNVAVVTSRGRLFIIPLLDVCHVPLTTIYAGTFESAAEHIENARPLRLSEGKLATPVVFEVHGGRQADQIDAYIARDRLLEGYHGVQLREILVEVIPGRLLLKDWNNYEWFGGPSFARPYKHGESQAYIAGYLVQVPKERWTTLTHLNYEDASGLSSSTEYRARLQGYVNELLSLNEDKVFQLRDPEYGLFSVYTSGGFILPFDSLDLQRADVSPRSARVAMNWALNIIIPCVYSTNPVGYVCDSSKEGVLEYKPWIGPSAIYENGTSSSVFIYNNIPITATQTSIAFLYRHDDMSVFVTAQTDAYLRR